MTIETNKPFERLEPPKWCMLGVRDIPQGFPLEPFEFYRIGSYWLKIVYFFTSSFSAERWTRTVHDLGQPNAGRTLKRRAGEWWWRLDGTTNHLILGIYELTGNSIFWFGAYNHPNRWEVIRQDGSSQGIGNGTSQSETFNVAGQLIQLRFHNPINSGGWTGNDIIYQVG